MMWAALVDHGVLRCKMRWIFRDGTGREECARGVSSVCLILR